MTARPLTCVLSACLPLALAALLPLGGCGSSHHSGTPGSPDDLGVSDPDSGADSDMAPTWEPSDMEPPDLRPPPDPRYTVPPTDWQAEHPSPSFGWIEHIYPLSANDAWLVGTYGTVLHWDGSQLTRMPQITTSALYKVWSDGPSDVWAIGSSGTVIRYDGTAWTPIGINASAPLTGIWGSGPSDIWVTAGDDSFFSKTGQLFHWNGTSFSKAIPDTGSPLFDIHGTSKSDVWAVGYYGTALHWDGGQWTLSSPRLADKDLNAIWASASNDMWIVGDSGTSLHWNGSTFTAIATNLPSPIFSGPPDMWAVSGFASNDIWGLAGGSYLIHGDGTKWNPYISPSIPTSTLWNRAKNELWVAGRGIDRYDGTSFTPLITGTHPVQSLFSPGTSDVFAQCEVLLRRDSSGNWNKVTLPSNTPLIGMWGSSSSDVWIVNSSQQYYHYNGSSWTSKSVGSPTPSTFSSVYTAAANDAWIADTTYVNQMWHFNGSSFTAYSVVGGSGGEKFGPVWGSASNDVWSAGGTSDFYHWNGSTWGVVTTGITTSVTWYGISGTASNNIWFVGDTGKIGHYDGSSFTLVSSSVQQQLNSVSAVSQSDVWAVGEQGTIVHFDGQKWSAMESGTRSSLKAVWAISSGDVWAAGDNGLLLHFKH